MKDCVLCVDIGTSSLKAALINELGKIEGFTRVVYADSQNNVARQYIKTLKVALDQLKQQLGQALQIECIVISGNGPTLISQDGTTLLWSEQIDSSSTNETSSLYIPRLQAFKNKYASQWNASQYIFCAPEYLIYQLTQIPCTILAENRYTQAYWTYDELKKTNFTEQEIKKLPPFISMGNYIGKITCDASLETGLLEGTLVITGGPDFIVALIGTATIQPGAMLDRAGTSEGINLCTNQPLFGTNIRTLPSPITSLHNASILIGQTGEQIKNSKNYPQVAQKINQAIQTLTQAAKKSNLEQPTSITMTGGQLLNTNWIEYKKNAITLPLYATQTQDAELTGNHILARVALGDFDTIEEATYCLVKKIKL